jgi:hypothetical protein
MKPSALQTPIFFINKPRWRSPHSDMLIDEYARMWLLEIFWELNEIIPTSLSEAGHFF